MNCNKTEHILVKDCEHQVIKSLNGNILNHVNNFKYLGSYILSSKKDFEIRKGHAWVAGNKLHTIWNPGLSTKTKINLFKTCVESILLYGSETWTMSKQLEKHLDGTYTRVVRIRRNCFAVPCLRAKEEIISDLLSWSLPHQKRGRKPLSYLETLVRDIDTDIPNLVNTMENRHFWKRCSSQPWSQEVSKYSILKTLV